MSLQSFLSSRYKREAFERFLSERFFGLEFYDTVPTDDYLNETEKKSIDSYRFLGKAELDDGKEIGFFEFRSKTPHIENKRVGYNAILKKLAYDELLDGAIAVFYHPESDAWRLSFVGFEYDEGRAKVTNLKRYTYVLGKGIPVKTPLAQLGGAHYPTFEELKQAFSVEKVSKEFFEKYHDLYTEISEYLKPQIAYFGEEKNINFFTKKLLGRIVFLYFLQKKGWLGSQREWGDGDHRFLSRCFDECAYEDFYFDILRPIFFEALNNDRRDKGDFFEQLDCRMPFLNGGLFSKDTFDEQAIIIGNEIFQSIFAVLDQYNFTIIEDSPLESEVAIDPEMLGRVFESLLDDRKDKGAFYTPREIVHYMSRYALEHYLKTEAGRYNYVFTPEEFLHKTSLSDQEVLAFYEEHPVKFIVIEDYFEHLRPYRNLVIDFYIVAKLRGMLLLSNGKRAIQKKGRPEITTEVWHKILSKEYEIVAINFGSNKEIKLAKNYKYPTLLKYIQIKEKFFTLAFMPNIWGDLELMTIFPIRHKEILRKLKKVGKPLFEISRENFAFDHGVYRRVEALREDCRPLHAEPLQSGAELPRQAVVQKGLSTFHKAFTLSSLADGHLKSHLKDRDYYRKTINKLLNESTLTQYKLKDIMLSKLKQIKVLDPAIGSGAFPMGVLHELVELRRHLGDTTPPSELKKEIIENAIYGIDIEPSAVEIAKLRFWLSIVVDEDTPTPLPNLYYKIMVGNSLLETINGYDPMTQAKQTLFGDDDDIERLQELIHLYFRESGEESKREIDYDIDQIIQKIFQLKIKEYEEQTVGFSAKLHIGKSHEKKRAAMQLEQSMDNLALFEMISTQRPTTELFFYKLYFAEVMKQGGFDLVIGNPPYVRQEKIKELKPRLQKEGYRVYNGTADLYVYFFEKAHRLLKPRGILSFITSNKYTRAKYGKALREFILSEADIQEYIDFNGVKVFESATVDTSILTWQKSRTPEHHFTYCDIGEDYRRGESLEAYIAEHGFDYAQEDLSIDGFSFADPAELAIKKRIEEVGTPLRDWDIQINYGLKTGFNEAFIIDGQTKEKLIAEDPQSVKIIKPLLRGKVRMSLRTSG